MGAVSSSVWPTVRSVRVGSCLISTESSTSRSKGVQGFDAEPVSELRVLSPSGKVRFTLQSSREPALPIPPTDGRALEGMLPPALRSENTRGVPASTQDQRGR